MSRICIHDAINDFLLVEKKEEVEKLLRESVKWKKRRKNLRKFPDKRFSSELKILNGNC